MSLYQESGRRSGVVRRARAKAEWRAKGLGQWIEDRGKRMLKRHRLYRLWLRMKSRCHNPNDEKYWRYGAKGIKVCARWRRSYAAFVSDMGPRPSPKHTVDRYPNNCGDYKPNNCRWATQTQQMQNRRDQRLLTFRGKTQHLMAWARELNCNSGTIFSRAKRGLPLDGGAK